MAKNAKHTNAYDLLEQRLVILFTLALNFIGGAANAIWSFLCALVAPAGRLSLVGLAILAALGCAAAFEAALVRECAPIAAAQVDRDAAIAYDARCDERTPLYAQWSRHLDCAEPRRTVARGHAVLTLECMLARQPFAGYVALLHPLVYPSAEHTLDWLKAAAAILIASSLLAWIIPTLLAWRREERYDRNLHSMMHAMKHVAAGASGSGGHASEERHGERRHGERRHGERRETPTYNVYVDGGGSAGLGAWLWGNDSHSPRRALAPAALTRARLNAGRLRLTSRGEERIEEVQ